MSYRATTQVKVFSPEILVVPVAEAFPDAAGSILVTVMRGDANPSTPLRAGSGGVEVRGKVSKGQHRNSGGP